MTLGSFVLDVGRVDRDAAFLLLGSRVDVRIRFRRRPTGLRENRGDRCRQRRLAVVNMPDRTNVDVRLLT